MVISLDFGWALDFLVNRFDYLFDSLLILIKVIQRVIGLKTLRETWKERRTRLEELVCSDGDSRRNMKEIEM